MVGVQLIGKESVLSAYQKLDADTWAIMQGKQLITSGEGEAALQDWLDLFSKSGSTATYTLRVYDTDSLPDSLTAGTNYIAALNFKLADFYQGDGIAGYNNKLAARVDELEKKLAGDEGDEEPGIMEIIMGWLKEPSKLQMAVGAFKALMSGAGQTAPDYIPAPQGVGGFADKPNQEETLQRLSAALDRLEKCDPQILQHLEKLADIAEKKPDTFKFLIRNLDGL